MLQSACTCCKCHWLPIALVAKCMRCKVQGVPQNLNTHFVFGLSWIVRLSNFTIYFKADVLRKKLVLIVFWGIDRTRDMIKTNSCSKLFKIIRKDLYQVLLGLCLFKCSKVEFKRSISCCLTYLLVKHFMFPINRIMSEECWLLSSGVGALIPRSVCRSVGLSVRLSVLQITKKITKLNKTSQNITKHWKMIKQCSAWKWL